MLELNENNLYPSSADGTETDCFGTYLTNLRKRIQSSKFWTIFLSGRECESQSLKNYNYLFSLADFKCFC